MSRGVLCWLVVLLFVPVSTLSQSSRPSPKSPPAIEPLKGNWDQIDERMVFLTTQLASVETSIDAVNKGLRAAGYQASVKQSDAERYRKGNELMDRNMGMPSTIRWDKFYGKTAEKFFYHPTDPNSTYFTKTVLGQQNPRGDTQPQEGVPSRQGLPVHQRPPQIDYIYRANSENQRRAEAEVAKLAGKKDALLARRRELEAEQSALWCKIAFRAVTGRELLSKPLYRFDLKAVESGATSAQRLEGLRAAMEFLRTANRLIETGEKAVEGDQARYLVQLRESVASARKGLDGKLMQQESLVLELGRTATTMGKFSAVVKRMDDVVENIADAHKLALDGDRAQDDQRKDTFRGLLQESLVDFAETVLAGDECVNALTREWKIVPDVKVPANEVNTPTSLRIIPPPEQPMAKEGTAPTPVTTEQPAATPPVQVQPARQTFGRIPQVVSITPANGDSSVDPAVSEIRVVFDQPMGQGYSWSRMASQTGKPLTSSGTGCRWLDDRTCVRGVSLEPNTQYAFSLNSDKATNFRSAGGVPLEPYVVTFSTGNGKSPHRSDTANQTGKTPPLPRSKKSPDLRSVAAELPPLPPLPALGDGNSITWKVLVTDEDKLRQTVTPEGDWRIEKNGLRLNEPSTLTSVTQFRGDFALEVLWDLQLSAVPMEVSMWGETFKWPDRGKYRYLHVYRKGDELTFSVDSDSTVTVILKNEWKQKPSAFVIRATKGRATGRRIDCLITSMSLRSASLLSTDQQR